MSVTRDGCVLLSANSGEDALAVFALPNAAAQRLRRSRPRAPTRRARGAVEGADGRTARRRRSRAWQLVGRIRSAPIRPTWTRRRGPHARLALGEGARRRAQPERPEPASRRTTPTTTSTASSTCRRSSRGAAASSSFPTDAKLAPLTPRAARQLRPVERAGGARRHADPRRTARSSTSSTSCARTAPTTRSWATTRAATATRSSRCSASNDHAERARAGPALPAARPRLRELRGVDRRPLLDGGGRGLRLRVKNWHQNYARPRPARTTSASTRSPGRRRASSSTRPRSRASRTSTTARRSPGSCRCSPTRTARRTSTVQVDSEVRQVRPRRAAARALLPERRLSGGVNLLTPAGRCTTRSPPPGAPPPRGVALRLLPDAVQPSWRRTRCRRSPT